MADDLNTPECDLCGAPARYILIDLLGEELTICRPCATLMQSLRFEVSRN